MLFVLPRPATQCSSCVHIRRAPVLQVAATVLAILGELARPHSILMASVRPYLTILQVWMEEPLAWPGLAKAGLGWAGLG
jgi:hypothetical protein